jgi:hypothetical protein
VLLAGYVVDSDSMPSKVSGGVEGDIVKTRAVIHYGRLMIDK